MRPFRSCPHSGQGNVGLSFLASTAILIAVSAVEGGDTEKDRDVVGATREVSDEAVDGKGRTCSFEGRTRQAEALLNFIRRNKRVEAKQAVLEELHSSGADLLDWKDPRYKVWPAWAWQKNSRRDFPCGVGAPTEPRLHAAWFYPQN